MINLDTPIATLPRVGEKYAKKLKKLGVATVRDLLFHFPFRYDDFSQIVPIGQEYVGQIITIEGVVEKNKLARIFRRRMTIVEAVIQTENNIPLKAVWFNQPYILDSLKIGAPVRLSGKLEFKGRTFSMSNPAYELAGRTPTNTGRLVPIYPETEGVSSKWLRWQISLLFKSEIFKHLPDPLPADLLKKLHLPSLEKAIRQIHFPASEKEYLLARKRFAFSEMLLVQLKSLQVKMSWKQEKAVEIKFDEKLIKNFVGNLPFKLTDAQRKASFEILKDLEKPRPMNRLLNGDVGSGKTVVAAIAALQAIDAGYQVALMAPTEVLAKQHFESFCKLFQGYDFNIGLLTNSYKITCHPELVSGSNADTQSTQSIRFRVKPGMTKENARNDMLRKLKSGRINLIIGTHALIQETVKFKNLALIIVDEQHRFGVAQRAYLQQEISNINDPIKLAASHGASEIKNKIPHLLSMTATPIPRTLSLAFFGNLDLSILDEMPKNRKKIITKIIDPEHRQKTYDFIRQEIKNGPARNASPARNDFATSGEHSDAGGRQVFVILPLVEESKILTEVKAAVQEHNRLSEEIFPDLKLGLLHGRLKSAEKEKVMREFAERKLDILVSTSVVEVGIDIPNASVMIIEDADRFGLSQLHQFRGRVGRAEHQSYCFLFTSSGGETAAKRLQALEKNGDGFAIAEEDLKQRGPGEFFGVRQSGLPDIAMENLANVKLIQISRAEAQNILKDDPALKQHPALAEALKKFSEKIHLE